MKLPSPFRSIAVGLILTATFSLADTVITRERSVTQLAPGVYFIRHKDAPSGFPNSNTTVIIGQRAVLVVDSTFLPAEARADIAQIRKWTDEPVQYLLNTHWHNDHVIGNAAYSEAFPSLNVIAQANTAYMMRNYIAQSIERYPKTTEKMRAQLASGRDESGKPLVAKERAELQQDIAGRELVSSQIKGLVPRMPDITFESELDLDLGDRPVQIKYLGHGNTAGDAVVFLPQEKILVAGDMVVHPVPFLGSGYPSEWAETLQRMIDLEPQIVVPGHGEVLRDTKYLVQVQQLLRTVVAQVRKVFFEKGNGRPFEDVKKDVLASMDFEALRRKFDGGDPENFDQSSAIPDSLVKNAFDEIRVR